MRNVHQNEVMPVCEPSFEPPAEVANASGSENITKNVGVSGAVDK